MALTPVSDCRSWFGPFVLVKVLTEL